MGFFSKFFARTPESLLLSAAKSGRLEKVISAVTAGAALETEDKDGNTALSIAVKRGYRLVVDYLISEKHADINHTNLDGCTPLMYAASLGFTDIILFLLDKGANIEIKNSDGFTALMWAAYVGNEKSVAILLESGADVTARNSENKRAIDISETKECKALLKKAAQMAAVRSAEGPTYRSNTDLSELATKLVQSMTI